MEQSEKPQTPQSAAIETEAIGKVQKELRFYPWRFQHEILSKLLARVEQVTDKADELLAMEDKVRAIYDRLDVRTKALFAVLNELARVDGMSVGVDYGNEIMYESLSDTSFVEAALAEHPDDADLAVLAEAYELAQLINTSDN